MKSCATSNADAQSSPALIRRFLFSTTTAASSSDVASTTTQSTSEEARTSSDASFNTVEAASKMHNLTAPMAVVASFVANATFDHPQQYAYSDSSSSSSLHRRRDYGSAASSIAFADDAMSSMSSMTAGEMAARESQPAHAPGYPSSSASSITAPTSPSTSSAHQAFSKIMEQNDRQRSVFDVLASKTRLYLSSGRDSNTIEEGQLRSGRRESSYKTTSPVTPEKRSRLPMELAASESDASSLYHVRVSSIESFPKHVMSNSSAPTMQYLRGLFRRASVSGAESTVAARVPADGTDSKAVNS
ncbi:hypothetical protein BGZ54_008305 [Gamsiella multidivaricata]|nr:hypothetical protein BGZ54_008305 [Gamsiella multidivaricata]